MLSETLTLKWPEELLVYSTRDECFASLATLPPLTRAVVEPAFKYRFDEIYYDREWIEAQAEDVEGDDYIHLAACEAMDDILKECGYE